MCIWNQNDIENKRIISNPKIERFADENDASWAEVSGNTGAGINAMNDLIIQNVLDADQEAEEKVKKAEEKIKSTARQDPDKTETIKNLEKYIERIESHKNASNSFDFEYGFYFFKKSRAINREINYLLAKKLLNDLLSSKSSVEVFKDVENKRKELINGKGLQNNKDYVDRGMNSKELNEIISNANKIETQKQVLKRNN